MFRRLILTLLTGSLVIGAGLEATPVRKKKRSSGTGDVLAAVGSPIERATSARKLKKATRQQGAAFARLSKKVDAATRRNLKAVLSNTDSLTSEDVRNLFILPADATVQTALKQFEAVVNYLHCVEGERAGALEAQLAALITQFEAIEDKSSSVQAVVVITDSVATDQEQGADEALAPRNLGPDFDAVAANDYDNDAYIDYAAMGGGVPITSSGQPSPRVQTEDAVVTIEKVSADAVAQVKLNRESDDALNLRGAYACPRNMKKTIAQFIQSKRHLIVPGCAIVCYAVAGTYFPLLLPAMHTGLGVSAGVGLLQDLVFGISTKDFITQTCIGGMTGLTAAAVPAEFVATASGAVVGLMQGIANEQASPQEIMTSAATGACTGGVIDGYRYVQGLRSELAQLKALPRPVAKADVVVADVRNEAAWLQGENIRLNADLGAAKAKLRNRTVPVAVAAPAVPCEPVFVPCESTMPNNVGQPMHYSVQGESLAEYAGDTLRKVSSLVTERVYSQYEYARDTLQKGMNLVRNRS